MLIKNIRTGVVQDVKERLALALIAKGACVEVKPEHKPQPAKQLNKKQTYKTKDLKAEV